MPGHHDVVRAHAVGDFITSERCGVGKSLGHTATDWHQIDFSIAIVLAGKGDRLAIRRDMRKHLVAFVARQSTSSATSGGHAVQVTCIGKNDSVAVNAGKAKQACFIGIGS